MLTVWAILIDGFIYASWLFLVAAGLTVIYGVMRILNMAHGSLYALGAYASASALGWYYAGGGDQLILAFAIIAASAMLIGALTGLAIERGLLRLMYGRDEILMLIITFAVLLILEDVMKLIWGTTPYFAYQPYAAMGRINIDVLTVSLYDLMVLVVSMVIGVGLWFWLERTKVGKVLRSIIHDREVSEAMGVNVRRMFTITFMIGATLGAIAGGITAPIISVVPGIGIEVIVLAFAVVVTGGLGSITGAAVGAVIVGLARATSIHTMPELELFIIYAVMAAVLIFRPNGLFGQVIARKI
ncbi:branched-chain amino acid ABC transporter permease [Marinobacter sp. NP-4(2019)]|uniref:branched-chain amino acid ABC transporter permease n=1 Tax=Marinobacter sp. NP-4(2019) TaxID=2488665 RepID=UPI000FC3D3B4|nr:branched-chain amino acid ABC transporter permease [Marinobacter sp. NP-4(2019)]AZT85255.1 branched-chain amino acid ABC transporter permease [Marinobacter sp. NP-4(2019)]